MTERFHKVDGLLGSSLHSPLGAKNSFRRRSRRSKTIKIGNF